MAQLIFNTARDDDDKIAELLEFTLALRKEINDKAGMAATLNSLGTLYEKQKKWDKAETQHKKSLETRMMMYNMTKESNVKERKNLAQQVDFAWMIGR